MDDCVPEALEAAELDVDTRLTDLWKELGGGAEYGIEVTSALMRAAYVKGYCDALTEGEPGALLRSHPEIGAEPR